MKAKTPVTIITGYLGSGKTTLLRNIAKESEIKIAILMNEFGEIAIDSKVIKGKNIEMAELAGGCVCCSLSGEFEAAIGEILEKVKPEWIVVETTGVAEPSSLASEVLENIDGVYLDSIITVVDLDSLIRFPNIGHTGKEQIELADILVLNKKDLIDGKTLENIKAKIKLINERALIVESEFCKVEKELIFGIKRKEKIKKSKKHKNEFEYFGIEITKTMSHSKVVEIFEEKLPKIKEIYRSKGFFKSEKGSFLVNYVAGRTKVEEFEEQKPEIVFIGIGISKFESKIRKLFE